MRTHVCFVALLASAFVMAPRAQHGTTSTLIPSSLRAEHDGIHAELEAATRAPGAIGAAAKELAAILHPHFVREQEIALPPLGALAGLAAGKRPADAAGILEMTNALRRELPQMLEEHKRIKAAVLKLRETAVKARAPKFERLADDLAHHALSEEEVLYPAAILVGDLLAAPVRSK
jgi:hypothetical protein